MNYLLLKLYVDSERGPSKKTNNPSWLAVEQLCIDLNWMVNETINIFALIFFLDKQ